MPFRIEQVEIGVLEFEQETTEMLSVELSKSSIMLMKSSEIKKGEFIVGYGGFRCRVMLEIKC